MHTHAAQTHSSLRIGIVLFVVILALFVACTYMPIASAAVTAELTQSYTAAEDPDAVAGALVSLDSTDGKTVELAESKNSDRLIGVLVEPESSSIAVNADKKSAQVATSGRVVALVSTMNGDIKSGDVLVLSAVRGVAAKTIPGGKIIGVAQDDFTADSESATVRNIKDNNGKANNIAFATIPIVISIGSEIAELDNVGGDALGWLGVIAGKRVPNVRIALAGIVAIITLVTVSVMIYSSVRNTIYGVSRNPLAKQSIFEALGQVMIIVMVVAALGVIIIYTIIRI